MSSKHTLNLDLFEKVFFYTIELQHLLVSSSKTEMSSKHTLNLDFFEKVFERGKRCLKIWWSYIFLC